MLLRWVGAGVTFIHFVSFSWQPFISIIAVHSTAKEDWLVGWLVGPLGHWREGMGVKGVACFSSLGFGSIYLCCKPSLSLYSSFFLLWYDTYIVFSHIQSFNLVYMLLNI